MSETIANKPEGLDHVTDWLSSATNAEYKFFAAVYVALYQFAQGNRDPLAKMITVCNGRKGRRIRNIEGNKLSYAAPLKRIMQHALSGVKPKADDSKDFGVAWEVATNGGVNHDKMNLVNDLSREGYGPKSKTFKEAFPPLTTPAEKTEAELIKAKKEALAKWCAENGIKLEVLAHALTAKETNQPDF
jgi:hypothetical protein